MPNDYRWFTASCCTNLPITTTTDNSSNIVGGRIMALERNSLIDRCPTPEVQEKNVEIAVKHEGGGQGGDEEGGDFSDNVEKEENEKEDEGSVAIELSSALLSMDGEERRSSCGQIRKGGRRC